MLEYEIKLLTLPSRFLQGDLCAIDWKQGKNKIELKKKVIKAYKN